MRKAGLLATALAGVFTFLFSAGQAAPKQIAKAEETQSTSLTQEEIEELFVKVGGYLHKRSKDDTQQYINAIEPGVASNYLAEFTDLGTCINTGFKLLENGDELKNETIYFYINGNKSGIINCSPGTLTTNGEDAIGQTWKYFNNETTITGKNLTSTACEYSSLTLTSETSIKVTNANWGENSPNFSTNGGFATAYIWCEAYDSTPANEKIKGVDKLFKDVASGLKTIDYSGDDPVLVDGDKSEYLAEYDENGELVKSGFRLLQEGDDASEHALYFYKYSTGKHYQSSVNSFNLIDQSQIPLVPFDGSFSFRSASVGFATAKVLSPDFTTFKMDKLDKKAFANPYEVKIESQQIEEELVYYTNLIFIYDGEYVEESIGGGSGSADNIGNIESSEDSSINIWSWITLSGAILLLIGGVIFVIIKR